MNLDARVAKLERDTHLTGEPVVITLRRFDGTPPTVLLLQAEHLTPKARHRLIASAQRQAQRQEALDAAESPHLALPAETETPNNGDPDA